MSEHLAIEAKCTAAAVHALWELIDVPGDFDYTVAFTECGHEWARVEVSDMTDGYAALFPLDGRGYRGDAERRQAHMGVDVPRLDRARADRGLRLVLRRAERLRREREEVAA